MITPRILKGFRDSLPEVMIPKNKIIHNLKTIFESFGFLPIDTPALEYTEILLGKGSGETDKQIYRFNDHGGRDVALRFDLTVPLARFVSQYYNELIFPAKFYHIAPVWRGENTQKGRFREFYQCDFDILGTTSLESDIEILLVIKSGLINLNTGNFRININHRGILNAFLEKNNLMDKSVGILRAIDKIYKIGYEKVAEEIVNDVGVKTKSADKILKFLNLENQSDNSTEIIEKNIFSALENIKSELGNDYLKSANELEYIFLSLDKLNVLKHFSYNPAITRGLDYYTGLVFESFILDRTNFGSICSGGRYDNLTGLYSKNSISGVGASFGLDRILSLMEDKNILEKKKSLSDAIIFNIDASCNAKYQELAEKLRKKNIKTEIVYDTKKIGNQFKTAEKKGIKHVIIAGTSEFDTNKYNLKNIINGEEKKSLSLDEIADIIKEK